MLRRNPLAAMALHRPARSLSLQHLQLAAEASGATAHGGDQQTHADQAEDAAEVRTRWCCRGGAASHGLPVLAIFLNAVALQRMLVNLRMVSQSTTLHKQHKRLLSRCVVGDGGDADCEPQRCRARRTHHTEGSAQYFAIVYQKITRPWFVVRPFDFHRLRY